VHHRRLFAPVAAAREKHDANAVAGRLVRTQTEIQTSVEVSAEV
jgi:hypothetical protein